ncbi:glutamine synthetase [Leucobacter weissii]|uniref:Glutamine synthetase n=1 Tax=Leucobacter weissii TaxID=1983706 RepID=A0A939SCA2_9MICO|nr:glutamine synthetase family protein [Leucobacter weissii]MBO1902158.1 glutamine synthetase [Leucobacter weissii]
MNNGVRGFDPATDLRAYFEENRVKVVKLGAPDIDGVWRGKRIMAKYFAEAVAQSGTNVCNIIFGWDLHDVPIPGLTYTGYHTGYPDVNLRPDLSTLHLVPSEPGAAAVICDVLGLDGAPLELAPRTVLRRVVDRANALGFEPVCAYEFEFYLFEGSPRELARRGYAELEPITAGSHTYSVYRDSGTNEIIGEIRDRLAAVGVFIEASNSEHGPGQFEVNIHYGAALEAADSALILKHTVKEVAAERGYTASFMAKTHSDNAGSSGHVHQSLLRRENGSSAFANPENPKELSEVGQRYLAGVVAAARQFTALYLPTMNSYKRVEGPQWAGSSATWGLDNRTVAVRSIPAAGGAARVENRVPGADANPYLVLAANIASGLDGIERELQPEPPIVGNAYALDFAEEQLLPRSLDRAVDLFSDGEVGREYFGADFVRHFAETRRWEIQQSRAAVTDWEIARYLEHV